MFTVLKYVLLRRFSVFDLCHISRGLPNKVSIKSVSMTGQHCQKFSSLENNPGRFGEKSAPQGPYYRTQVTNLYFLGSEAKVKDYDSFRVPVTVVQRNSS